MRPISILLASWLFLLAAACGDDPPPDPDGASGSIDAPAGAIDAPPGTIDAPGGPVDAAADAPPGACVDLAGTWGYTGTCGADVCTITQSGCVTQLACSGGAASYTGSVTGAQFSYAGTTGGGTPATCSGSLVAGQMTGTCTISGVTCAFTGQRL